MLANGLREEPRAGKVLTERVLRFIPSPVDWRRVQTSMACGTMLPVAGTGAKALYAIVPRALTDTVKRAETRGTCRTLPRETGRRYLAVGATPARGKTTAHCSYLLETEICDANVLCRALLSLHIRARTGSMWQATWTGITRGRKTYHGQRAPHQKAERDR